VTSPLPTPAAAGHGYEYRHTRREDGQAVSRVRVGDVVFGGERCVVIAGPCSVEEGGGLLRVARSVRAAGAAMLRGGAFKPRTSPYDFQGLGPAGLDLLVAARDETGLPFVTEVLDPRDVDRVAACADMLQIGSRSVQNFPLLREAGASGKPVLLKRGMMTTIDEWLSAAEYVCDAGGREVVLCERGIRTFESSTRNTLDLNSLAVLRARTHLPVIADPSHAAGYAAGVPPLGFAALAAGADGLIVEVHDDPDHALSDGGQSLHPEAFAAMLGRCRAVAAAVDRSL